MFNLRQFSLSVATLAATVTLSAVFSTAAQAAIVGGRVSGVWQSASGSAGGFNVGDTFTADYTYDSDSITTTDQSGFSFPRNLVDSVPLLSLVLNSGTVSHTFDFSTLGSYSVLLWQDYVFDNGSFFVEAKGIRIDAADYSASEFNRFYASNYLGSSNGTPLTSSEAVFLSENTSTNEGTDTRAFSGVAFSSSSPTSVPTPALLPGLIGLGLGVLRKRKAVQAQAVSD